MAGAERYFRKSLKASPGAIDYLKHRGLTGETARDFGIGFAPDAWDGLIQALSPAPQKQLLEAGLVTQNEKGRVYDRFRGRVMFPIRDTRGRIIGFGGRVFGDQTGPKYLNSPETPLFHKGRELYGLYEARRALRRLDRLIVVEGYMDVVALAQSGIANAVATLGTAATPEHFQKLYRYTEEVVCCFDGDAAGRQAAWRALESALPVLGEGRQLKFMFVPEGDDPDSLVRAQGKEAFLQLAGGSQPAIEYLFARLAEGLDLTSIDDQARLASLAAPHIERVPEGVLKQLMGNRLQTLTGLAPARVAGRSTAATSDARHRGPSGPASRRVSTLSRRLLGNLLRKPALLHALPASTRQALLSLQDGRKDALQEQESGTDLFLDIVKYIDNNPDVDLAEILGRWSGTADHSTLVALLGQPAGLAEGALQAEFTDGVDRYLQLSGRADRQKLLAEVRKEPSREKFEAFWTAKRAAGSAADEGNSA